MSETSRLSLPYIAPQQAQKQVTYNSAMARLDQLVQLSVLSRSTAAPPGSPAAGDTYVVGASPTGDWSGHADDIACWSDSAWGFTTPAEGWTAHVADEAEMAVFDSGSWTKLLSTGGAGLDKFGVNTDADLTNRLAVASDASLFTHAGTSHRMNFNKAGAGDTASLIFEDGYSGRAELGLMGDDDFRVKVSPDGTSWHEALRVSRGSGLVTLPLGQLAFPAVQNASADPNTLDDYEEGSWTPGIAFGGASTGITYGANTAGRYTKIGRTVFLSCFVDLTSKGTATGNSSITGLPFTALNDSIFMSAGVPYVANMSSVTGFVTAMVRPGYQTIILYRQSNGATTNVTSTNFTNTTQFYLSGFYDT